MNTKENINLFDQVNFAADKESHSNNSPHRRIHSLIAITVHYVNHGNVTQILQISFKTVTNYRVVQKKVVPRF